MTIKTYTLASAATSLDAEAGLKVSCPVEVDMPAARIIAKATLQITYASPTTDPIWDDMCGLLVNWTTNPSLGHNVHYGAANRSDSKIPFSERAMIIPLTQTVHSMAVGSTATRHALAFHGELDLGEVFNVSDSFEAVLHPLEFNTPGDFLGYAVSYTSQAKLSVSLTCHF